MEDFGFDEQGRYVIRSYAGRRPFASFLPGIIRAPYAEMVRAGQVAAIELFLRS